MIEKSRTVCIFGGGVKASAIAATFFSCGFSVIMYVDNDENFLRHNLCFGDAIHQGSKKIENVTARTLPEDLLAVKSEKSFEELFSEAVEFLIRDRKIPVIHLIEPEILLNMFAPGIIINTYSPQKTNIDIDLAPLVIGLYPLHQPGKDCHISVESRLNYQLGRPFTSDTVPDNNSFDKKFFNNPFTHCHSPIEGVWIAVKSIGDIIKYNEPLGKVNEIEIRSPYNGQIWGITHSGHFVAAKSPVSLVFQGQPGDDYLQAGFQEIAIAGGVLKAALQYLT